MYVSNQITTVDHHHGQASRTVLAGYPCIRGETMREKAEYYLKNMSWVHESLIREPRGHKNMLGGILTEPVDPASEFGILFLHSNGLFDGCGDSTFSAASAVIETGRVAVEEPLTRFSIDTVNGPLHIEADVENGILNQVRFENIPSYFVGRVVAKSATHGNVDIDIAFGGNSFGFVDASAVGLDLQPENEQKIIAAALDLWASLEYTELMVDAQTGEKAKIELFTFVTRVSDTSYRVANVYKPGCMGRTPSGTGTSAHVALRIAQGSYDGVTTFHQESVLGLTFTATARKMVFENGDAGVVPKIGSKSYMMGIHQFVIDPKDPYARGFILGA